MNEGVGQPVLIFLGRPPAFVDEHAIDVPSGESPEDIARRGVVEFGPEFTRIAQKSDGTFLSFISLTLFFAVELCQFGGHNARATQQFKGRSLGAHLRRT